jgi:branched-chain amino acid transport system ATP-binding protein
LLELHGVHAAYGDLPVLRDVTLSLGEREIVSVVGANGAGKSTLLKTIAGLVRPTEGWVELGGERLDRLPTSRIVERGVVRVPEGRKIFPEMTVRENLELGAFLPRARARRPESLERVLDLFPILRQRTGQMAGTLSGGEQQMLAIGRGLMSLPRILMLDEPSLGLAPIVVREIFAIVRRINADGTAILLVEQDVFHSLSLSHRGYVLENGQVVMEGPGAALLANEHIRSAYLGI